MSINESTLARMAGNIAAALVPMYAHLALSSTTVDLIIARRAAGLARLIVAELAADAVES